MNRFTLMCDNPYTTCIMAERELNKLIGEVDKLRQVKDRLLEENARLQAERDKAVEDLENLIDCHCACNYCANLMPDGACEVERKHGVCTCLAKWRGLEESE